MILHQSFCAPFHPPCRNEWPPQCPQDPGWAGEAIVTVQQPTSVQPHQISARHQPMALLSGMGKRTHSLSCKQLKLVGAGGGKRQALHEKFQTAEANVNRSRQNCGILNGTCHAREILDFCTLSGPFCDLVLDICTCAR